MYEEFLENKHLERLEHVDFPKDEMYIIFARECDKLDFKPKTDAMGIPSIIIE